MELKPYIRDIEDFPTPGILFKDITPLLMDPKAFKYVVDCFAERYSNSPIDSIVGIEARGFIFGAPLAQRLEKPLVLARKPGKLPAETVKEEYELEYGTDGLEIHTDAVSQGEKVLIVDDLLATGGTAAATVCLVEKLGGQIEGIAFLIELTFLRGREKLGNYEVVSFICYDSE